MDVVDPVTNQNPVSKKLNDDNINRLNNSIIKRNKYYYNNNLEHNNEKTVKSRNLSHANKVTSDASHFGFKKWRRIDYSRNRFLSHFFQRWVEVSCNFLKLESNKQLCHKLFQNNTFGKHK